MPTHVAILLKPYIRLILDGKKTVESRLTQNPIAPFRKIAPGDRIYFKASSGPYMATAVAARVAFHDSLTPTAVAALRHKHNKAICGDPAYWQWKRNSRYATLIRLRDVKPTTNGPDIAPSRGLAWFVLDGPASLSLPREWAGVRERSTTPVHDNSPGATGGSPASATAIRHPKSNRNTLGSTPSSSFDAPLTPGAIRNNYVVVAPHLDRFPADAQTPRSSNPLGNAIFLRLPDGKVIQSDLVGQRLRWRGWKSYFETQNVRPGDKVRFTPAGPRTYHIAFVRC